MQGVACGDNERAREPIEKGLGVGTFFLLPLCDWPRQFYRQALSQRVEKYTYGFMMLEQGVRLAANPARYWHSEHLFCM